MRERYARVAALVADAGIPPGVLVDGHATPDCCWVPGRHNRLGELVAFAGGHILGSELVPGYAGKIAAEYVLASDPAVLIATGGPHLAASAGFVIGVGRPKTEARAALDRLLAFGVRAELPAVRAGRAHGIAHALTITPLDVLCVECLARWIHPERAAAIDPAATLAEINARSSPCRSMARLWACSPSSCSCSPGGGHDGTAPDRESRRRLRGPPSDRRGHLAAARAGAARGADRAERRRQVDTDPRGRGPSAQPGDARSRRRGSPGGQPPGSAPPWSATCRSLCRMRSASRCSRPCSPRPILRRGRGGAERKALALLARLVAADRANAPLERLSGGQRQVVALALALPRDPRVLLLDEPTSALDLARRHANLDTARDLAREGRIVVAVLHDIAAAAQWADAVAVPAGGRLAGFGTSAATITPELLARVYRVSARVETCSRGRLQIMTDRALSSEPPGAEMP